MIAWNRSLFSQFIAVYTQGFHKDNSVSHAELTPINPLPHLAQVPTGQAKYVFCTAGAVFNFFVDLRVGSPTFGQ
jgi:dTDP-4-dehydrorhamnose 3,5-epimerase-like enzyme